MKAFVVLTIGRQVDGELISVNVEKGFLDQKKAAPWLLFKNDFLKS